MSKKKEPRKNKRQVVYRRPSSGASGEGSDSSGGKRPASERLAPALRPLIMGFILLLILVAALGFLSVRRLDKVVNDVNELRDQQVARMRLLLQVQLAVSKLYNTASARMRKVSGPREDVKPLFNLPLGNARKEVVDLMPLLEREPLPNMPLWKRLHDDIAAFIATTQDEGTYTLKGFTAYRSVDDDLGNVQRELEDQRVEMIEHSNELERQASRAIFMLTVAAFGVGSLVVIASLREVQRRFNQNRASEEEARRERLFSTQMLEGMVSALVALDAQDRIRSANAAFFEIFPGARIGESIYDKSAPAQSRAVLEAAATRRVEQATYFGRWPIELDSRRRVFDVYVSPLAIDGEAGQIVTMVDVTEVAEAEAALRRSESLAAVGQAAAQLAHEIKNPLGSIRLGVSMLRDSTHDPDSVNTIDLVERGIHHLNNLVVDVTQFSREKALTLTDVDLGNLMESSVELVADKLQEKGIRIEKNYSPESITGHWDEDQLRQVFVNLIGNAADASSDGSAVEISTSIERSNSARSVRSKSRQERHADTERVARIVIRDHGVGMDEQTSTRIFEPFFTTKRRGTGLGLAVVKKIIDQHNGSIRVNSKKDRGTTFVIELPMQISPAPVEDTRLIASV
jgi:signal transduction histidine kinase